MTRLLSIPLVQKPGFNPELHVMRALGIMLVIMGHSLDPFLDWRGISELKSVIYSFHMPLFFFVAGFFGGKLSSANWKDYGALLWQRFGRLMVPYLFLSILVAAAKLTPGLAQYAERPLVAADVVTSILLYPVKNPMITLWFVYVLFAIQVLFLTCSCLTPGAHKRRIQALVLVPVSLAANLASAHCPAILGLDTVANHAIYVVAGILLRPSYRVVKDGLGKYRYLLLLVPLLLLHPDTRHIAGARLLYATAGILATWVVACALARSPTSVTGVLYLVGDYAYAIYLYGYFFGVTLRIVFIQVLGWAHPAMIGVFFLLPILGSILLAKYVLQRNPIVRGLALGEWPDNVRSSLR